MPNIPIIMPQLGESIAEAAIINFLVQPGDSVLADQDLIEVETNKATMTVTSPCSGRMKLDSSVSMALTSHSASTAQHSAQRVKPEHLSLGVASQHLRCLQGCILGGQTLA